MKVLSEIASINREQWAELILQSSTSTWFQTGEAYDFYAAQPELFTPFVVAVANTNLRGICVGYITVEQNPIKQFITRRAIIVGGPVLADDITSDELSALLQGVKQTVGNQAIYIETRNFNDYSRWRNGFIKAGFTYEEHNNFHIETASFAGEIGRYNQVVAGLMGKNRVRDIKTSFRDGVVVIDNPTLEQVREYYKILKNLYTTKVKTPLFPLSFFEKLYEQLDGKFILVEFNGEIVGGTVCVAQEGKCLYEWFVAGRDGEWKSVFPSSVATYAGIRYAAEHNMPRFDMMGAGTPQEAYGVRDFKARFGGQLVEHGRYKYICKPLLYKCGEVGVKLLKKI